MRLIVRTARGLDLAGASVFPVEMSFGARRHVHDAQSDYGFTELPVVIEIVETRERIEALLIELGDSLASSFLTVERSRIVAHSPRRESMIIDGPAQKVTIYVGSRDLWHGRNLAVAIVERCRELGLAGATMTRGIMGFGKNSRIHRAHLLGLSDDLPERIEVVDSPEQNRLAAPDPGRDGRGGSGSHPGCRRSPLSTSRREITQRRARSRHVDTSTKLALAAIAHNQAGHHSSPRFYSDALGLRSRVVALARVSRLLRTSMHWPTRLFSLP